MNQAMFEEYTIHDRFSDPGPYATALDGLPEQLPALHRAINGVLIHNWKVRAKYPHLLASGEHHTYARHISHLLGAILERDDRPLDVERPVERRVIVDCRHFALLLCSVLRHRGIAARPRCGFASYLEPTHLQDHWVSEHWSASEERWVLEDADLQRHAVPAEDFITGVRAWQLCRADSSAAERFGFDVATRGMFVVRANHVRDVAALNGFVSISGDAWGLALAEDAAVGAAELELLDRAAELASDDADRDARRALLLRPGLAVPALVDHFDYMETNNWRKVDWAAEA